MLLPGVGNFGLLVIIVTLDRIGIGDLGWCARVFWQFARLNKIRCLAVTIFWERDLLLPRPLE